MSESGRHDRPGLAGAPAGAYPVAQPERSVVRRLGWLLRRRAGAIALGAGLALVAAALAGHWLAVEPLARHVQALESQRKPQRDHMIERLGDELARTASPQAQLAGFYGHFAGAPPLTERLARVHAIAGALGLEIVRADYRLASQPERKLDRYQMVVPIRGSYPKIRAFVTEVLRALPTLSLDQVQFQRKEIADGAVDAQISFTFFLAR